MPRMKQELIDQIAGARDFPALTRSVLALCEPHGAVHAFRLIHNRGAGRVACFIELESQKEQAVLARALGGRVVNGAVCLDIPVRRDFARAAKVAVLPAAEPRSDARFASRPGVEARP